MANYRKRVINCSKMLKKLPFLNTHEQTLVTDEYIRIRERLKDFGTPHVIRSTMVSRVCELELVWPSYGLFNVTVSIYEMRFVLNTLY